MGDEPEMGDAPEETSRNKKRFHEVQMWLQAQPPEAIRWSFERRYCKKRTAGAKIDDRQRGQETEDAIQTFIGRMGWKLLPSTLMVPSDGALYLETVHADRPCGLALTVAHIRREHPDDPRMTPPPPQTRPWVRSQSHPRSQWLQSLTKLLEPGSRDQGARIRGAGTRSPVVVRAGGARPQVRATSAAYEATALRAGFYAHRWYRPDATVDDAWRYAENMCDALRKKAAIDAADAEAVWKWLTEDGVLFRWLWCLLGRPLLAYAATAASRSCHGLPTA